MKHHIFFFSPLLVIASGCVFFQKNDKPREGDGTPNLFNGRPSSEPWTVKFFYQRGTENFSSTGFVVSKNVILTSGHSLAPFAAVNGGPALRAGNFELGHVGTRKREKFSPKVLFSVNEFPHTVFRNGFSQKESWEMGALVLPAGSALILPQAVGVTRWPLYEKLNFKIVSTGANAAPLADPFNDVIKQEGFFKVESVNDQIATYDMSIPGTPLTAVGDSGAPLAFTDDGKTFFAAGSHNGNYANGATGAVSNGFASSLFFPGARSFWKRVMQEGGQGVELLFAHTTYLECLNKGSADNLNEWLPLQFEILPNFRVSYFAVRASAWHTNVPFTRHTFTESDGRRWQAFLPDKVVDVLRPSLFGAVKSSRLEIAKIKATDTTCVLENKQAVSLPREALFSELKFVQSFQQSSWDGSVGLDANTTAFSKL